MQQWETFLNVEIFYKILFENILSRHIKLQERIHKQRKAKFSLILFTKLTSMEVQWVFSNVNWITFPLLLVDISFWKADSSVIGRKQTEIWEGDPSQT